MKMCSTSPGPEGTMDKNPPANAGDRGSIPSPKWLYMAQSKYHNYWVCMLQWLKFLYLESVLRNKRSHHNETPTHCNEE